MRHDSHTKEGLLLQRKKTLTSKQQMIFTRRKFLRQKGKLKISNFK